MEITVVNVITNHYIYKGRDFMIVYLPQVEKYGAIESSNVTDDGKLLKKMNGLQMHLNETVKDTIESIMRAADIDELISAGYTKAKAMATVFGITYTPELEKILN